MQGFFNGRKCPPTLDALKRLLLRESQVQPLLLVFEDLHWIDSETQALLDSLYERAFSAWTGPRGSEREVILLRPAVPRAWAAVCLAELGRFGEAIARVKRQPVSPRR